MRELISGMVVVMLLACTGPARAAGEDFGQQGQFIVSANRLVPFFAFTSESYSIDRPNNVKDTTTQTNSSVSLLWGGSANGIIVHTVPRVGFDYTILEHLTLGGDILAIFGAGGSRTDTREEPGRTTEVTRDAPRLSGFGFVPRVGYIIPLSSVFYLWLRGGFGIYTFGNKVTRPNPQESDSTNYTVFALGLDPQLVISPIPHTGITVGLPFDIPLAGSRSEVEVRGPRTTTTDWSYRQLAFGINLGLLVYF
jgi:hypothetical protein